MFKESIIEEEAMATESSEGEEDAKLTGGNQLLVVDDDLREMGKKAAWSVSSCKAGNGVSSLRDDNLDTYWQSDGAQPHLVNVQFQRKVQCRIGRRRKEKGGGSFGKLKKFINGVL
ncbi:anaphase-promoting complex subunit 10-like [Pyrus x bretschneideri]|uniref:anaphase-promoting complex subunit 10-like n=1 Tax=Pyrus x bretschneideri TaxID=225117 RepID=UPI002030BEF8|nr:anaphase-promoting complex subunit 10-like [Pyrus x bretschneideri]